MTWDMFFSLLESTLADYSGRAQVHVVTGSPDDAAHIASRAVNSFQTSLVNYDSDIHPHQSALVTTSPLVVGSALPMCLYYLRAVRTESPVTALFTNGVCILTNFDRRDSNQLCQLIDERGSVDCSMLVRDFIALYHRVLVVDAGGALADAQQ